MGKQPIGLENLAVLAGTLLMASQLARPLAPAGSPAAHLLWGLSGVGAALIVVLALTWALTRALRTGRGS